MKATVFCARHDGSASHVVELDLPNVRQGEAKRGGLAFTHRTATLAKDAIVCAGAGEDWSAIATALGPCPTATLRRVVPALRCCLGSFYMDYLENTNR